MRPKSTIIVTAYYDSGCATPLTAPERIAWLRPLHLFLLSCMVVVLATLAVDSFGDPEASRNTVSTAVRWFAIAILGAGALALFVTASSGEDIRGANNNASGAAALLGIAERLKAHPIESADVWLVATGSHEAWMGGMRRFLATHRFPRDRTYLLNLESIGTGRLYYLKSEGFLHRLNANQTMTGLANAMTAGRPIRAGRLRAVPTEAHIPLTRNMKAMTLMALNRDGLPANWNQIADRVTEVDTTNIAEIIDFSCEYLPKLADEHAAAERDEP